MTEGLTPVIQRYYDTLESRIGYRLFLGGTRHFGYYASAASWPWPITPALRKMEEKLLAAMSLPAESKILDAGCGIAHVALYMARNGGYQMECIDLTPRHVRKSKQTIEDAGMQKQISVRQGDYHHLEAFKDDEFDGMYTMETLVHSSDPRKALLEFKRILKPGGRLVMHEYDHSKEEGISKHLVSEARMVVKLVGMPAFDMWDTEGIEEMAKEVGFENIRSVDMSDNVAPMLWLFYIVALIPYYIFKLFGLQYKFINTTASISMWRGRHSWRYAQVTCKKPLESA